MPDTVALLRALLREQAPELAGLPLTEIPAGQDNSVVRVGEELVARLPRHEHAVPLIRNEVRWLPAASAGLPVAAPVPVLAGRPSAHFPWPWSVSRWVPAEDHHHVVRGGLDVDDDTWARARGWALVLGVMFARIGHRDGDAWFASLAGTTLDRACPP